MSDVKSVLKPLQRRADIVGAGSQLAREFDNALDLLARIRSEEKSIKRSIRESRKAIRESRILLANGFEGL